MPLLIGRSFRLANLLSAMAGKYPRLPTAMLWADVSATCSTDPGHPLVACHDCGRFHALATPPPGYKVVCSRCDAVLRSVRHDGLHRAAAFSAAALILLAVATLFPLLTFKLEGREQPGGLLSGVEALWSGGYPSLALLVLFTVFVAPLAKILATLYVTVPLLADHPAPRTAAMLRILHRLRPWAMIEVFLLGLIVAYVKLSDLATLAIGPSLFALIGLIVATVWADAALDSFEIWERLSPQMRVGQAAGHNPQRLVRCHDCGQIVDDQVHDLCPRCDARLHRRKPDSLHRTAALAMAAAILYVPANLFPIMTVIRFGAGEPDTILSGVKSLIAAEMWPVAVLVFFASITVPVLKLVGLAYLMLSVRRRSPRRRKDRTRLYRIIEGVGRWSMVDIFMIALLGALVKLGAIASVAAEPGAVAFAAVVVITMLASHAFDPRLIWDGGRTEQESRFGSDTPRR